MFKKNLLLILFTFLFSQNDDIRIMDITVEGNQRLSAQDIQRNARLYKGMSIQGPEIQEAIKRLWNLKRFGNIQILVDNETDDGIYLRIIVEENPTLGEVEYDGNKKNLPTFGVNLRESLLKSQDSPYENSIKPFDG